MNEDQQNFESLRRLLALKRHETPPPGYFNNFSRQVMARIRAGEARGATTLLDRIPWLVGWLDSFEAKPVFAGGFATGLCALLILGAVMAQRPETGLQAFLQPATRDADSLQMVAAVTTPIATAGLEESPGQIMIDNSTNPVVNFQDPFSRQTPFSVQPVSFPISGN